MLYTCINRYSEYSYSPLCLYSFQNAIIFRRSLLSATTTCLKIILTPNTPDNWVHVTPLYPLDSLSVRQFIRPSNGFGYGVGVISPQIGVVAILVIFRDFFVPDQHCGFGEDVLNMDPGMTKFKSHLSREPKGSEELSDFFHCHFMAKVIRPCCIHHPTCIKMHVHLNSGL